MNSENQEPPKPKVDGDPDAANQPEASAGTPPKPESPQRTFLSRWLRRNTSPAQWLLMIALLVGLLVAAYLWWRSTPPLPHDDFKAELVIIQLNDIYRVDAVGNGKLGGLSRVATLIRQTMDQGHAVLVVHAGDFIAPSLESKIFRGKQMIDALNFLNRLAPLYVVPGNHEFDDDDPSMVLDAIERSNFEWLGSNVTLDPRGRSMNKKIVENMILPVGNLKLGIFALTLHGDHKGGDQPYAPVGFEEKYLINDQSLEAMASNVPPDVLDALKKLKNQEFQGRQKILTELTQATGITDEESLSSLADEASIGYTGIAERQIEQLEKRGAQIVIALTHLNMPDDRQISQLRRRHPNFMWIAGGHEHYSQRERLSRDTALITKGDSNARSVWRVSIGLSNGVPEIREERIDLNDQGFALDEGYERDIAANYRKALQQKISYIDRVIGSSESIDAECLDADEESVRNWPSNWGSFIADQMRVAYGKEKAQIGIFNGGGIRIDDRPCGTLRFEHLERTFGFPTTVGYVRLTGEDLKQSILEHAVAGKRGDGRFLQLAGIKFDFDRHRLSGNRVFDIQVQNGTKWEEFDKNKMYSVAVPDFLYTKCGDGYKFREKAKFLIPPGPDIRALVYKALQDALAKTKTTVSDSNKKGGATELPDYTQSSLPQTGVWNPAPISNPCPR